MKAVVTLCMLAGAVLAADRVGAQTLEHALRATLQRHPAVTGQAASVQARQSGVETASAARYPTLSAQVQQLSGAQASDPLVLRVRQPLWAFGRIDSGVEVAQAELGVEQAALLRVQRQQMDATAGAYAQAVAARERLEVARDAVAQSRHLHEQIERREAGQLASRADVVLAATRLAQALASQQRAESEWRQALDDLRVQSLEPIEPVRELEPRLLAADSVHTLAAQALQDSAEVRLQQAQVRLAQRRIDEARVSALPTVYLQAERQPGYGAVQAVTRAGVALEASLDGAGLAAQGRTREAVAREAAAQAALQAARQEVERRVRSWAARRDLASALLLTQAEAEQQLGQLLASYQRQYAAGTRPWLDVLNIQRELTEQRLVTIQARADARLHALRLGVLVGRLDVAAGL